jgi:cysteine desulfurase
LKRPVYLDHHATTPLDPRVLDAMRPYLAEDFGNPASASHLYGWRAEAAVESARERIAAAIGAADPSEIVFTSGTTESDNLALAGVLRAAGGGHVVTVATEHPAVLDTCRALEREGVALTILPVDADGLVDPDALRSALRVDTRLVSVMTANSEIGVLQPLAEISAICREREIPLHSDAAQAVGKLSLSVASLGVDLLSFCAHKLYGPKGIGALFIRKRRPRISIAPLFHGGGHERGLRPGTLAVPQIVGFARALEVCAEELATEMPRTAALRDRLHAGLRKRLDGIALNGHATQRLAGNLNLSFAGVQSDAVLARLHDVACSSGSACASGKAEPSPVLLALGGGELRARSALRFGLGRGTSEAEIDFAIERVTAAVEAERRQPGAAPRARAQ